MINIVNDNCGDGLWESVDVFELCHVGDAERVGVREEAEDGLDRDGGCRRRVCPEDGHRAAARPRDTGKAADRPDVADKEEDACKEDGLEPRAIG